MSGHTVSSLGICKIVYSCSICAVKGSTVDISCSFKHPSRVNVLKRVWFTKGNNYNPEDLKTDPVYAGRVSYSSDWKSCTLTIRDLRESDSAVYKFRFETDRADFTGLPGVTLTVTGKIFNYTSVRNCYEHDCVDANPTANYTWYKEDEDSEKASGHNFTITDFRPEHSGSFVTVN
uniref:B-cell receptor CD22 first Ig-like domain-containing protein n=1 Tax=Pundamilia nyererei TaxID=303518 RepID=A0A3B4H8Z8_9CICH